jgi:hypothetical protein
MCVDVTDGNIEAGYVQLWECSPGNTNQKWSTILV